MPDLGWNSSDNSQEDRIQSLLTVIANSSSSDNINSVGDSTGNIAQAKPTRPKNPQSNDIQPIPSEISFVRDIESPPYASMPDSHVQRVARSAADPFDRMIANIADAPSVGSQVSDLGVKLAETQVERLNRSRSPSPDGKPKGR